MAASKFIHEPNNSVITAEPAPAPELRFSRIQKFGRSIGKFFRRSLRRTSRRPSGSSLSSGSSYSQLDSKKNIVKVEQTEEEINFFYPLVKQNGCFVSLPETLLRIPIIEDMKPIKVRIVQHTFFKGQILVGELYINVLQDVGLGMISRSLLLRENEKSIYQNVYAKPVLTYRIDHALDHPAGEYAYLQLIQVDTLVKCMITTPGVQAVIFSPNYMGLTIETDDEIASKHIITDAADERLVSPIPELIIDHQRSNESMLNGNGKPSINAVSTHSMTSTNASLCIDSEAMDDYLMSIESDVVDRSTSEDEEDPLKMLLGYGQGMIDASPIVSSFPSSSLDASFDFTDSGMQQPATSSHHKRLFVGEERQHPFYPSRSNSSSSSHHGGERISPPPNPPMMMMTYTNFLEEKLLKSSSSSLYYHMQQEDQ